MVRIRADELVAALADRLPHDLRHLRERAELVRVVEEHEAARDEQLVDVLEVAPHLLGRVVAVDEAERERPAEARLAAEDVGADAALPPGGEELVRGERVGVRQAAPAPEADVALELLLDEPSVVLEGDLRLRRFGALALEDPRAGREERVRPPVLREEVDEDVRREPAERADLEHWVVRRELRDRDVDEEAV